MIEFKDIRIDDLHAGDRLLLGLPGREPSIVGTVVRLTKTQIVLEHPASLIELRYERRTGCRVGHRALGVRIKGLAMPEEASALESQRQQSLRKAEDAIKAREEINRERQELMGLFPGGCNATVSGEDVAKSGTWVLTLDGLSDSDIKELADFMHMPEFRFRT